MAAKSTKAKTPKKNSTKEVRRVATKRQAASKPAEKKAKANTSAAKQPGGDSGLRLEIWGLLLLALAVVMLLSLITYTPADPGIVTENGAARNLIGRAGAYIALAALQGFGYSAYLATFCIGALGIVLGMRRTVALKLRESLGIFLIVICCSVLLELLLSAKNMPYAPGGLVGGLFARLLQPLLGDWGLGIVSGLVLILAVVLATSVPPMRTAGHLLLFFWQTLRRVALGFWHAIVRVAVLFAKLLQKLWNGLRNSLQSWREKRALAAAARAELENEIPNKQEVPATSSVQENAKPQIIQANGQDSPVNPESSDAEVERVKLLDHGEREVAIQVRRPVSETERPVENAEIIEEIEEEIQEEENASPDQEALESVEATTPPSSTNRRRKKRDEEEPQIVDQRPKRPSAEELPDLSFESEEQEEPYELPPLSLLSYTNEGINELDREQLYSNARLLEQTLMDYKIEGKVQEIHPGPVITMYEFAPARGTKISRISNLEDDLAMALAALKVRIVAPIPGKSVVGIEVPSANRETVYLKEIIAHRKFAKSKGKLTVALGKDIFGYPVVANLQKMPHLLIAGATGAGKSVGVNGMILSILYRATPDDVKFILIDPKRLEFNFYEGIPHLLLPVVTDPKQAALALAWTVHEMDQRYKLLSEWGTKNIDSYNRLVKHLEDAYDQKGGDIERVIEEFSASEGGDLRTLGRKLKSSPPPKRIPYIVVVIDELADLMMVAGKEVEISIARLAQLARASGIHLIVATQRPSTDVLTGLIKNNFPARISFRVSQKVDSRTILDMNGAESLLGMGDMLYRTGSGDLQRIHGAFVSEQETASIVDFVRHQRQATYQSDILDRIEQKAEEAKIESEEYDSEYDAAVAIVCDSGKASISMLQRKLRIGYNRAARIVEKMEEEGIVGPSDGVKGRPVYGRPISMD